MKVGFKGSGGGGWGVGGWGRWGGGREGGAKLYRYVFVMVDRSMTHLITSVNIYIPPKLVNSCHHENMPVYYSPH